MCVAAVLAYAPLVRWRVRKAVAGWAARHGKKVSVGRIAVGWGWVRLESVTIRSSRGCPILSDGRVRVGFSMEWSGRVSPRRVDVVGAKLCLERFVDGHTNLEGLFGKTGRTSGRSLLLRVEEGALVVRDRMRNIRFTAEHVEATVDGGKTDAQLERVVLRFGRRSAALSGIRLWGRGRRVDRVSFHGGRTKLLPGLLLTDIEGTVRSGGGAWSVKATGGYGGAAARLWNVKGVVRPKRRSASFDLTVQRFSLSKLESILDRSGWGKMLVDRERTLIAADLHLEILRGQWTFSGVGALADLSIRDARIAKDTVRGLGFQAVFAGTFDAGRDRLRLDRCRIRRGPVELSMQLDVSRLRSRPRIVVSLRLPRTDCGVLLASIPKALVRRLDGMVMHGPVWGQLDALVDFGYLTEETVSLDAFIDHRRCRVTRVPFVLSAGRLRGSFVHEARDHGIVTRFVVGPANPDYVPLFSISRHVVNAILTTEDSRFFSHHGFISREFRRALARNIIARRFRYGASSITMQLAKNVLLGREKTLARKLQELILTAYLERHLTKQRLLEIYLNVIEFGPGIYGIGKAARFYFGKPAALLEPQEAAFFSTILPDPKRRFRFFCRGSLTPKWRRWVDRILVLMHERHRLTTQELDQALQTPVIFSREEFRSRSSCRARIRRYLGR